MRYGPLPASFVPSEPQRDFRDLTCQRTKLIQESSCGVDRVQASSNGADIKLGSMASSYG